MRPFSWLGALGGLLATGLAALPAVGAEALRRLDAGDTAAARRWLDWAWVEQKDDVGWFNPFSGTPFGRIWWTAKHDDPAAVRLAAAALAAEGATPQKAIPILLDAKKADDRKPQRLQNDRALARAYRHTGRPEQLLETAELYRKVPRPDRPLANDTWVLAERRLKALRPQ